MKVWEANAGVRKFLTAGGLDTDLLMVNTVCNTVFIKGGFRLKSGVDPGKGGMTEKLREVQERITTLEGIEHVRWEINGWRAREGTWEKTPG